MGCFGLGHAQYVQAMGTSASAPLAAGVAALVMAAHPNWSAAAVLAALRSGATTLPGMAAPQIGAAGAIAQ
jgi:subtilisin family serine protease